MKIHAFVATDRGQVRECDEDCYLIDESHITLIALRTTDAADDFANVIQQQIDLLKLPGYPRRSFRSESSPVRAGIRLRDHP